MSSYYKIIDGQRYDRSLLELADSFTKGRGESQISFDEAKDLLTAAGDGRGITPTELATFRYLLDHYKWTDKARNWLLEQIPDTPSTVSLEIEKLLGKLQLEGLRIVYDEGDIQEQEALPDNKLPFVDAFEAALRSFLNDDDNIESPRSIVIEVFNLFPEDVEDAETKIQEKLRHFFRTGRLQLLPDLIWKDDADYEFYPPEDREPTAENWIFSLSLPDLSDHIYWAIVDRTGKEPAYNYGFN